MVYKTPCCRHLYCLYCLHKRTWAENVKCFTVSPTIFLHSTNKQVVLTCCRGIADFGWVRGGAGELAVSLWLLQYLGLGIKHRIRNSRIGGETFNPYWYLESWRSYEHWASLVGDLSSCLQLDVCLSDSGALIWGHFSSFCLPINGTSLGKFHNRPVCILTVRNWKHPELGPLT